MLGLGKKVLRRVMTNHQVEIAEMDGVRSLYIDTNTIQSSMKVSDPYALMLNYSKGMMGFKLFKPEASSVWMVGLGGGSLVKYLWKYCPEIKQTVVEINHEVIEIAKQHFHLPENDDHLKVIEGDGLAFLKLQAQESTQPQPDLIMIDAFDGFGIPPDFCTQSFFDDCADVLKANGLMAINLWGSDKNFAIYWQRMLTSFDGQVLKLPTGKPGNIIVFAFNGFEFTPNLNNLLARAKALIAYDQIDYTAYVETLFEHNPHLKQQLVFNANG